MSVTLEIISTERQLALLGGKPAFPSPLHVGRPNIGDREKFMAYAEQMFDNSNSKSENSGAVRSHGFLAFSNRPRIFHE